MTLSSCSNIQENEDILFQVSTIDSLLGGVYDGEITYKQLRQYGDFGIGTFNGLDGEMVGLGNKFYQIKANGLAYPVNDLTKTPFAIVTFFEPDKSILLDTALNYGQLRQYLDNLLPTQNIFYAIKIEGIFTYIKTRSIPKQNKPYLPLAEIVKNQPIFEFSNVKGAIVGFRLPAYMKGINVPGYHLHFITESRNTGGHLLECQTQNVRVEIDYMSELHMILPESSRFYQVDLTKERQEEVEK
ncbi:MAG: acetolactate decarboxylase [Candidatus Omnitrophica bacterium]|nr:acetolactate decarboxylase [Candidatus Omnitrophota bacterium]